MEAHQRLALLLDDAMETASEIIISMPAATTDAPSDDLKRVVNIAKCFFDTMQVVCTSNGGQTTATTTMPQSQTYVNVVQEAITKDTQVHFVGPTISNMS
jgi:hypothetical protein